MKNLGYHECMRRGTPDFPVELYQVDKWHLQYIMPYHWHIEPELIHIVSGELQLLLNGESILLHAGETVWINSGALHSGIPNNCVYACLVFDLHFFSTQCPDFSGHLNKLADRILEIKSKLPMNEKDVADACQSIFSAMKEKKVAYRLVVFGAITHLLGTLFALGLYRSSQIIASPTQKNIKLFKKLVSFIETNYTASITLSALAGVAGMSPKYFCRYFRNMTGRTPIDYLNVCRIEHACNKMLGLGYSVTEAALTCGFNDISHFIRTFKKYKLMTPKQYILQIEGRKTAFIPPKE